MNCFKCAECGFMFKRGTQRELARHDIAHLRWELVSSAAIGERRLAARIAEIDDSVKLLEAKWEEFRTRGEFLAERDSGN